MKKRKLAFRDSCIGALSGLLIGQLTNDWLPFIGWLLFLLFAIKIMESIYVSWH